MHVPRPALSRTQVALLALVLAAVALPVGAVRVADYHPLSPSPSPAPVPEDATPAEVLRGANGHLERSTVTVRMHTNATEATGLDTTSHPVRYVYRADAERKRLHTYLYHRDGNRTWTTSCSYLTDGASVARSGTVRGATRPGFCETGDRTWHPFDRRLGDGVVTFGFGDWQGPPPLSEAWTVASRNESTVLLRTTSFAAFAATNGRPVDEDVVTGSYAVYVDATTGRLARVERVVGYRTTGGEVRREETVYRFSRYGRTDVSPPDALGYPSPGELVHDVLVY